MCLLNLNTDTKIIKDKSWSNTLFYCYLEEIEEKIKSVNALKDKEDVSALGAATEELVKAMQKIGESLYNKSAQPEGEKDNTPPSEDGTENKESREK